MNWDETYAVSRSLVLQIGSGGELLAGNSVSRRPCVLSQDALPVLLAFAAGRTPADALKRLQNEWELDETDFSGVVETLLAQNLLTHAGGDATLTAGGFASPVEHFLMIRDTVRVSAYRRAIFRHCKDKTVVEIGCGSGILSIFAAKAGARRVIAIEESRIADLAAAMFEANCVADRIELRRANSRDVSLEERADVIIHEVLGVDPFGENVLPFIDDARERMLAPDGVLIPSAMDVFCVGFETPDVPYVNRTRACAELAELEGMYGIDFSAFEQYVKDQHPDPFPHPLGKLGEEQFLPAILTEESHLYRIDFTSGAVERQDDVRFRMRRTGRLGGVLVYFRARLDDDNILGNTPWAPATSWGWNARPLGRVVWAERDEEIPLVVELRTTAGRQNLHVDLPRSRPR